MPRLPAVSADGSALGAPDRASPPRAVFASKTQFRLVVLDLGEQVIAAGDHSFESFF